MRKLNSSVVILLFGLILLCFIWIGLYYKVQSERQLEILIFIMTLLFITARQKRTAQALKQARDELEVKVGQRTEELFDVNEELVKKNTQLAIALQDISLVQANLVQQEKMAGIGQLAAGVAHEINNPLGFITSNMEVLEQYFNSFIIILVKHQELRSAVISVCSPQMRAEIDELVLLEKEQDLDYMIADIPDLFRDTSEGLKRMNKIVKGMGAFSRIDQKKVFKRYDLNQGLENAILMANNAIENNATIEKTFGQIPKVEVIDNEINQVLLNLIFNGVQAIKEQQKEKQGVIKLSTWHDEQSVYCTIEDDGVGIMVENLKNIFNPFFTTKPVGQGTGMGLSISYEIIVNRHQGDIMVESLPGKGTKFILRLPIKHDLLETIKNGDAFAL